MRPSLALLGAAMLILAAPNSSEAQSCADIPRINQSVQRAAAIYRARFDAVRQNGEVGRLCPMARAIEAGANRMLAIIETHPAHCGQSPAYVDRLRRTMTHYELWFTQCR